MDELSGSESGTPAPDQAGLADRPDTQATGEADNSRDPGPAETLTREEYARQIRDRPPAGQDNAQDHETSAGRGPETTQATELAEPRSRLEVADEARAGTVRPIDRSLPDAPGGQGHADGQDGSYGRFSVVQADRTMGDVTPAGIGLKPTGEQLRDMESDKLARGDRFRKNVYERVDDIQDSTEKTAGTLQGLLGAHRPTGQDVTFTAQPAIDAPAPPPADAGNIATAGLALGLLADRAIHWARDLLRRPKG